MARVRRVRRGGRRRHPRRRRALPDLDGHDGARRRRKGGDAARPPTARTPRPRRPSPASTCSSAPTSTRRSPGRRDHPRRVGRRGRGAAPSSSSRCERRRRGRDVARGRAQRLAELVRVRRPRRPRHARPRHRRPRARRGRRAGRRRARPADLAARRRPGNPARGCAPPRAAARSTWSAARRPAAPRRPRPMWLHEPEPPARTRARRGATTTCCGWSSRAATRACRPRRRSR